MASEPHFDRIGEYDLVLYLGGGGMGEVWSVVNPKTRGTYALKVMHPHLGREERYREMFEREATVAAQLGRHPNFVSVHDFDRDGDLLYLVMDFVDGVNLRQFVRAVAQGSGALAIRHAVHITRMLLRCLSVAHSHRISGTDATVVHGDIKPENILVTSHGDIFVTDFGIARFVRGSVHTGAPIGSAAYMAPEQFNGYICPQNDLYAAGSILHELLGRRRIVPSGMPLPQVVALAREGAIPPLSRADVPGPLERLRQGLLHPRVESRIRSAEDALELLRHSDQTDCRDELQGLYQRFIGAPHSGLTQYLQRNAPGDLGSFLPTWVQHRDPAQDVSASGRLQPPAPTKSVPAPWSAAVALRPDPAGLGAAGSTVALSDEQMRRAREGQTEPVGGVDEVEPPRHRGPDDTGRVTLPPNVRGRGGAPLTMRRGLLLAGAAAVLFGAGAVGLTSARAPSPSGFARRWTGSLGLLAPPPGRSELQIGAEPPRAPESGVEEVADPPRAGPLGGSEDVSAPSADSGRARRPPERARARSSSRTRAPEPPVDVRVHPGKHVAVQVRIGEEVFAVDFVARAFLVPGRYALGWRASTLDPWTPAGVLDVPSLRGEFLFVRLGTTRPRVTRRKKRESR